MLNVDMFFLNVFSFIPGLHNLCSDWRCLWFLWEMYPLMLTSKAVTVAFSESISVQKWAYLFCLNKCHSICPPLLRRGLYKALSHGFCACSGVLKIIFYWLQKLGTVHQTADSCTPSDSQAYSPGQQKLLRGNWAPSFGLCSGHSGDVFPTSLDP